MMGTPGGYLSCLRVRFAYFPGLPSVTLLTRQTAGTSVGVRSAITKGSAVEVTTAPGYAATNAAQLE